MFKTVIFVLCVLALVHAEPACRFAHEYTDVELSLSAAKRKEFFQKVMYWEGKFHQDGVGFNLASGLTYDGHPLNYETGEIEGEPHTFSASSKESLHVSVLARVINKDPLAQLFVSSDPIVARDKTIEILTNKIRSYEKFNSKFPGYGGFLPWFVVNDEGMVPVDGWYGKVPSLDNGQLLWAIVALIDVLKTQGFTDLATRYQNYLDIMSKSIAMVFYEGNGNIRTVALISDIYSAPYAGNYKTESPCGDPCYLDDPYEGELFAFYLCYYGGISQAEQDLIWNKKAAKLQSVTYQTTAGPVTTQRGWWFSAHEQWKFMVLPYLDIPIVNRIFMNGEKARTWDAFRSQNPGLFASINDVTTAGKPIPSYISATGIQELAFQPVQRRDVITGYGSYPLFLAKPEVGAVWYNHFLKSPKCQNPYGATEAININGTMISPLMTWDSKITTVSAILGGTTDILRKVLKDQGLYDQFYQKLQKNYEVAFPVITGDKIPFGLPTANVPTSHLTDFTTCKIAAKKPVFRQTKSITI